MLDKTVVVTGAGRGIGRACTLRMHAEGAKVTATDIDPAGLATLPRDITIVVADLTTEEGAARLAAAAPPVVHALVNAAATVRMAWIPDMTFADWRLTLRAEVDTVFLVTRALWARLVRPGGSIVNFASASAHGALKGLPAIAHTAGKGAVLAMTRQMAMEGGRDGIRANTVSPGFTVTEETRRHLDDPALMAEVRAKLMIDRLGTAEDVAALVLFLASEESRQITGADYSIDGGATAW